MNFHIQTGWAESLANASFWLEQKKMKKFEGEKSRWGKT